MHFNKRY
jgi:hypothetical protein